MAINRFRIVDAVLDGAAADLAAATRRDLHGVSVAHAHLGATIRALPHEEVMVVRTSDPGDAGRVAGDRAVRAVRF